MYFGEKLKTCIQFDTRAQVQNARYLHTDVSLQSTHGSDRVVEARYKYISSRSDCLAAFTVGSSSHTNISGHVAKASDFPRIVISVSRDGAGPAWCVYP